MMPLTEEAKEYVQQLDRAVESRIKLWIVSAALVNLLAIVGMAAPIIFYLGGIYSDGRQALIQIKANRDELVLRGVWMQDRERWEYRIEEWASQRGFKPDGERHTMSELTNRQLEKSS